MNDQSGVPTEFLDKYAELCRNPLRSRDEIVNDLTKLLQHEGVAGVTFFNNGQNDTLVIGTKPVIIFDKEYGVNRYIGEFLIYITRRRNGRAWEVSYHFSNVDNMQESKYEARDGTPSRNLYVHPHMTGRYNEELTAITGNVCIDNTSRFYPHHFIRRGELYRAFLWLDKILHSEGPNQAWLALELWPEAAESGERKDG